MKAALLLSALASCAIGVVAAEELKVEVTNAVECERKTQKGDQVSMHYRGTLLESGKQFDASEYILRFFVPYFPGGLGNGDDHRFG
jgi:FK506-binding protein 2